MISLTNKTVLITGSNGGIGSAIVEAFKKEEANLILIDKDQNKHIDITNYFKCDLTNKGSLFNVLHEIKNRFEVIDVLINNAGIGFYKRFSETSLEDFDTTFKVNVDAPFIISKILLEKVLMSEVKTIINIGSFVGVDPVIERSVYCASKFALRGFSLTLSEELKDQLKISYYRLGSVLTDFGPLDVEDKLKLEQEGKKYLKPFNVASDIINRIQNNSLEPEIILNP